MGSEKKGNWWIWRVFWILLAITTFEVLLGIFKVNGQLPEFIVEGTFLGLAWLTHVFIILTLVKAAYIVMTFMHLGDERKSLRWTILLPAFILVPYLLFIILSEAIHANSLML
jgi:cytochrome c oxidase subunit IV